jgi:hypothetical protein
VSLLHGTTHGRFGTLGGAFPGLLDDVNRKPHELGMKLLKIGVFLNDLDRSSAVEGVLIDLHQRADSDRHTHLACSLKKPGKKAHFEI